MTVDPRQAAVVKLATLGGLDGAHVAAVVSALDPIALPLFLELGSVLFFAAAFPRRKQAGMQDLSGRAIASAMAKKTKPPDAAKVGEAECPMRNGGAPC